MSIHKLGFLKVEQLNAALLNATPARPKHALCTKHTYTHTHLESLLPIHKKRVMSSSL